MVEPGEGVKQQPVGAILATYGWGHWGGGGRICPLGHPSSATAHVPVTA